MFKHNNWKRKILLVLAIFLLLSISIISIRTNIANGQGRPTPPGLPTGLPDLTQVIPQVNNNATATPINPPEKTFIYLLTASPMTPYPTPTEIIISKVTDLSPDIDDTDKFQIFVRHPDGTVEQFNIGPLHSHSDMVNGELPAYILAGIPLQPGDEIGWRVLPVPYQRFAPGVLETLNARPTLSTSCRPSTHR